MNSSTLHSDSLIPVLTEIISIDNEAKSIPDVPEELTSVLYTEQSLAQLEKTLNEDVLRQLLTRVDFVLEHRIRDGLADVLQTAAGNLAEEIRRGLSKSLEEVIHRAISQEISKIQTNKT